MTGLRDFVFDGPEGAIAASTGGTGPAVLLLHGFPQTRAMWRPIAARLIDAGFTVVTADLRGYGASHKPLDGEDYSFRAMARDMVALMAHLGHARYHLVGHDRGARTAHRLALDDASHLLSLTLMDIVPTHLILNALNRHVARAYYHWFFLAQPAPFPETMIGHDPQAYYESCLLGWGASRLADFDAAALAEYRAAWADPEVTRGMCADYRATLDHDFTLDTNDLKHVLDLPALILYGADGAMARAYDVPATWKPRLSRITAAGIPGGHFFPDTAPEATAMALISFLHAQD